MSGSMGLWSSSGLWLARWRAIGLALVAVVFLTSACSADTDDDPDPDGPTTETTEDETATRSGGDDTTSSTTEPPPSSSSTTEEPAPTDDPPEEVPDTEIAAAVLDLAAADAAFSNLDVEVTDGVVLLGGIVDDGVDIDGFVASVAALPGVVEVQNDLDVAAASIGGIHRFGLDGDFETRSTALPADLQADLDDAVRRMTDDPALQALIEGHTDDIGPADGNLRLSQRRADQAKAYLVGKGIAADRITAVGLGETEPAVPNDSAANRAINRRTEVTLS